MTERESVTASGVPVCSSEGCGGNSSIVAVVCWVAVCFGIATAPASAQTGWRLDTIAGWGGQVADVELAGNLAYIAAGTRLVVLDMSDESQPVEIGAINLIQRARDIALRGDYVFVAVPAPYRLAVVDVSDPTEPRLVSWDEIDSPVHRLSPYHVELYGDVAHIAASNSAVGGHAYNISNPLSIEYLGESGVSVRFPPFMGDDGAPFRIRGGLLFATADARDLRIYDLAANPVQPPVIGELGDGVVTGDGSSDVMALDVEGSLVAIVNETRNAVDLPIGRLSLIDVSDPTAPSILGSLELVDRSGSFGMHLTDVTIEDDVAYVTDHPTVPGNQSDGRWSRTRGLLTVNISDPTNPQLLNSYKPRGGQRGVDVFGDRAYVFDDAEGLVVLDVTDPADPVRLGNYASPRGLVDMVKVDDLLYVSDPWNGFWILDVSDPYSTPQVAGVYRTLGIDGTTETAGLQDHRGIAYRNGLIYLAGGWSGLDIVDVSDPSNPTRVGTFENWPQCVRSLGLDVDGDIAHVGTTSCGGGGFLVNFDVSDVENVVDVGSLWRGQGLPKIRTLPSGVALATRGFQTSSDLFDAIDTTDPTQPEVCFHGPPGGHDLFLDGTTLYLAKFASGGDSGVHVFDVSEACDPQPLSKILGNALAVTVADGRVYATRNSNGQIDVYDVRDPTVPRPLLAPPGSAPATVDTGLSSLLASDRFVFAASEGTVARSPSGGLQILELRCAPDVNGDGRLDLRDRFALFTLYGAGDDAADLNGNGTLEAQDFVVFQNAFIAGCPTL